jgi:hypothetical protein
MLLSDEHACELATDLLIKFHIATENYEAIKDILKHEEPDTERYELIRREYIKAVEQRGIRHSHAMIISCDIIQSIKEHRWN